MRPETRQCLADARSAADEAASLATTNWPQDRLRALAIERLLMIMGEALVRIRDFEPAMLESLTDAHKIM